MRRERHASRYPRIQPTKPSVQHSPITKSLQNWTLFLCNKVHVSQFFSRSTHLERCQISKIKLKQAWNPPATDATLPFLASYNARSSMYMCVLAQLAPNIYCILTEYWRTLRAIGFYLACILYSVLYAESIRVGIRILFRYRTVYN